MFIKTDLDVVDSCDADVEAEECSASVQSVDDRETVLIELKFRSNTVMLVVGGDELLRAVTNAMNHD